MMNGTLNYTNDKDFTGEDLKKLYALLAEATSKSIERYAFGIIYQDEPTRFSFLDGTDGYGSPYVDEANRDKAILVKDTRSLWQKSRLGEWK